MKKQIIISILVLVFGSMLVLNLAFAQGYNEDQCNANNPENCPIPTVICGNGEHVGNPHCIEPTVSPTTTPIPTGIPGCDGDCTTPTPTPTPTEVKNESTIADVTSSNVSQAESSCTASLNAPLLQGFKQTSQTSVWWNWWASKTPGIDHQWVEYGYSQGNYPYNVTVGNDITGFEIGAQDPNALQHWARVCVQKGACVACSNDLDP
jgi:hypothetical protein